MKSKILILVIILFAVFSNSSHAVVSGVGGTDFLRTGVGARAQGLGYSFVAISDDATAGFWNPAGLIQLRENEFTTMSSEMFDVKYNYYGTALPVKFSQGKPKGVLADVVYCGAGGVRGLEVPGRAGTAARQMESGLFH